MVDFGTTAASSFTINSDTQITATHRGGDGGPGLRDRNNDRRHVHHVVERPVQLHHRGAAVRRLRDRQFQQVALAIVVGGRFAGQLDGPVERGPCGSFAAQSGPIGASSSSTLSVTLTESAGEFSFWRKCPRPREAALDFRDRRRLRSFNGPARCPGSSRSTGSPPGQHTFTWIYWRGQRDAGGQRFRLAGRRPIHARHDPHRRRHARQRQFSFDASGASIVVSLNGEIHNFAAGEFTNYVFQGDGGSERRS